MTRLLSLLSVIAAFSATGCLGHVEHDCLFLGVEVDFYDPSSVQCNAVEIGMREAVSALDHKTRAWDHNGEKWFKHFSVPDTLHEISMYRIDVGFPVDRARHQNPQQADCDLRVISVQTPGASIFAHEIGHVLDNCNTPHHENWDKDGRTEAEAFAESDGEAL